MLLINYRGFMISSSSDDFGSKIVYMMGTLKVLTKDGADITAEFVDDPSALYAEGENLALVMRLIDKRLDDTIPTTDEPLSLLATSVRCTQHQDAKDATWRQFLDRLQALVPSEVAIDVIAGDFDKFVSNIVQHARFGDGWMDRKLQRRDFDDYGFEGWTDATSKLQILKEVWAGIIEVDWKSEDNQLRVYFRAIELVNARLAAKRDDS